MDRRHFINSIGTLAISYTFLNQAHAKSEKRSMKSSKISTAGDLNSYLRSLCDVKEPSVDRIIFGNSDTKIKKVGTAWMPYWKTCRQAVNMGINVLIVHEPTFYSHWDLQAKNTDYFLGSDVAKKSYLRLIDNKKQWLEDRQLVIIRCHDVLDKISQFGIPYAFGIALGFSNQDIATSQPYYNVYRIEPKTAIDVAQQIAAKLNHFNQPGVAFYGDEQRLVSTVGLGTGCICNPLQFMDLKPDFFIAIDDSVNTWVQTTYAEDSGHPLVVINHGTSEENGMRLLNKHLQESLQPIEFIHLNQGCGYRWITA
jgi:putative NIF3 family GTP cyclohydrolase 1 type 2